MSASVALVFLSASTTVTTSVSPDRYATSLLRLRPVGDGVGVGDGVAVGVGVGTAGADSVVKLQE